MCKVWAGRLAWLGHLLDVQKVAGPNPARPTPQQSNRNVIGTLQVTSPSVATQV
jgi:hypothetical protein